MKSTADLKGGERSINIHIIVKKGMVVGVYDLSHIDISDRLMEEEFEYKVEYLDEYEDMDKES